MFGEKDMIGNTSGNLMNGGLIVRYRDEYYFTDFSNKEYLSKVDINWKNKEVIHKSASRNFNLKGDKLIFCDMGDKQKIKCLDLITHKVLTLVSDECFLVNVFGEYIFYRNNTNGQKMYRYSLLSGENLPITSCRAWYITPTSLGIYFRNYDILRLAFINFDGGNYQVLSEDIPTDIIANDNFLYYGNWTKGKKLTKLKLGHSDLSQVFLCEDEAFSINVLDDIIFYSNWSDNKSLYRIKDDGSDRRKIIDQQVWCINILDGRIYYRVIDDDTSLYCVDINGSNNQKIL